MRSYLVAVLEKTTTCAVIVGVCLPPWNLFWWLVGALLTRKHVDASGDIGLGVVILPGAIAALPFQGLIWLVNGGTMYL